MDAFCVQNWVQIHLGSSYVCRYTMRTFSANAHVATQIREIEALLIYFTHLQLNIY
jgi:hypothetical protein